MSLLSEERKKKILEQLNRKGKVKVVEMAEQFQVSTETIRRDLDLLEGNGLLRRVYGGAVKTAFAVAGEPPFYQRTKMQQKEKRNIGKRAAELVRDGDTIAIDTGTTMYEFALQLKHKKRLTIFTSSIPVSSALTELINNRELSAEVILLGGHLNTEQLSMSGRIAESALEPFHLDKAFISVGGISLEDGISDYDIQECFVSQAMIRAADDTIVLGDHTKIGVRSLCRICGLEEVDVLVCSQPMPDSWRDHPKVRELSWIAAENDNEKRLN